MSYTYKSNINGRPIQIEFESEEAFNNAVADVNSKLKYSDSLKDEKLAIVLSSQSQDGVYTGITNYSRVDTYEEYLKGLGGRYDTIKNTAISAAGDVKDAAYKDAERTRQRSIVDAHSAGAQNKATYGANAEQMGAMGLTSSGYSDYINAKAHATERAEVQGANAQATYAQRIADQEYNKSVAEANATYEQNMINAEGTLAKYQQEKADAAEAERKTKYAEFVKNIPEGATAEQIKSLAKLWGIDDTKAQDVADYVTKYALEEETPPTAMDLGYTTLDQVENSAANLDIDAETRDQYKAQIEATARAKVQYQIDNGDLGTANSTADELYAANQLSEATYQEIKADLATRNISGVENEEDYASVQKDLKQMLKKEQITESQYTALINKLDNKFFEIVLKDTKLLNMSSVNITQGTQIYDREVKIGEYSYTIVVGAISPNIHNALKTLKPTQTQIVDYNGTLYLYDKNKASWYSISEHNAVAASRGAPTTDKGFYFAVQNLK